MSAAIGIDLLRFVAALALDHGGEAGIEFAARVAMYEAGARGGLRLDDAFGLTPDHPAGSWWALADRAERDDLVCRAAEFFPAGSANRRAHLIHDALTRYETASWRRDCAYASPPARIAGTIQGLAFRLLKSGGGVPSCTLIRQILAKSAACLASVPPLHAGNMAAHDRSTGDCP